MSDSSIIEDLDICNAEIKESRALRSLSECDNSRCVRPCVVIQTSKIILSHNSGKVQTS